MKQSDTKDRILEAALELFSRENYDSVGVDQIAAEAGIKGPSLYRHYKSKNDIFNNLVRRAASYYSERTIDTKSEFKSPDSLSDLYSFTMNQVETFIHEPKTIKVRKFFIKEQFRNSYMGSIVTQQFQTYMENLYSKIFADMIEKKIIKAFDPVILAMEYVSPVILLIHQCDREPSRCNEITEKLNRHLYHFNTIYGI